MLVRIHWTESDFVVPFQRFNKYLGFRAVCTTQINQIKSPKIFYLEYLAGLTDPNHRVQSSLESRGFKIQKTYNFEGVGFIFEYQKI